MLVLVVVAAALTGGFFLARSSPAPKTTSVALSTVVRAATDQQLTALTVNDATNTVTATYRNGHQVVASYPVDYGSVLATQFAKTVKVSSVPPVKQNLLSNTLINLLPMLLILSFLVYFARRMGAGGKLPGISSLRTAAVDVPATTFADVGGATEAVTELAEIVDFLQHPDKYTASGARVPHGVLLVGPPGTGKTLLAKAVAGEAGVAFFALSGSDFVEAYVGVGASRMRQIFSLAKKERRAIVFIDELDAVGRSRGAGPSTGANDEADRTLNALLVEMDGFEDSGIIVLAATNRPEVLDAALTRPGRFDRQITVGAPDRRGRSEILTLLTRTKVLAADCDLEGMARRTSTLTGADLDFLINEAALQAARTGRAAIAQADLEHALEVTVIGRARSSLVVDPREREITAWHEAGHTVAALVLPAADNPVRVSIIPRGAAGGVTWMDADDRQFVTKSHAEAQLTVLLAGRAGEIVLAGDDITSGAANDIARAGHLATLMVCDWSMSDLGPRVRLERSSDAGDHAVVDAVDTLLAQALESAQSVLHAHRVLHRRIAEELLAQDTIDGPRLRALYDQYATDAPAA